MSERTCIRSAVPDDAPAIAVLGDSLGYPAESEEMRGRLRRLLARGEDVVLVVEDASGIRGWIHAAEREALETGPRCEILGLVVDRRHRRSGLGRALMAEAERWAAGRALSRVVVRSNVARPEPHPFYERLGYARTKTQHVYQKSLEPLAS